MQPHELRVLEERTELQRKINGLQAFIGGAIIRKLPAEEQQRLEKQLSVMKQYAEVLTERIDAFPVDSECVIKPHLTRVCERGTERCDIIHSAGEDAA